MCVTRRYKVATRYLNEVEPPSVAFLEVEISPEDGYD